MRHGWIDRFCGHLDHIIVGRAAAALPRQVPPFGEVALVRLQSWLWLEPKIDMGRKAPSGTLMPVRIEWSDGPLLIVPPCGIRVHWTARGLGHDLSGKTEIRFGRPVADLSVTPEMMYVIPTAATAIPQLLKGLEALGAKANWDAAGMLRTYLTPAAVKANVSISRELNPELPGLILDEWGIESVVNHIELGVGDTSHLSRLVNRCTAPGAFEKVDPMRYVRVSIERDVQEVIRQRIGDPRIGRSFRSHVREGDFDNLSAMIESFNAAHPRSRMGKKRAATALLNQFDVFAAPRPCGLEPVEGAPTNR